MFAPGYSSVGRAVDCRSIGPVFKSQCPDIDLIGRLKPTFRLIVRGSSSNGRAHA